MDDADKCSDIYYGSYMNKTYNDDGEIYKYERNIDDDASYMNENNTDDK